MCTEAYKKPSFKNFKDMCVHLTNYSMNKNSEKYIEADTEFDDQFGEDATKRLFSKV